MYIAVIVYVLQGILDKLLHYNILLYILNFKSPFRQVFSHTV